MRAAQTAGLAGLHRGGRGRGQRVWSGGRAQDDGHRHARRVLLGRHRRRAGGRVRGRDRRIARPRQARWDAGGPGRSRSRRGVMSSRISLHTIHSYRQEDREINRLLWQLFWKEGFTFTVDPHSGEPLSIPHLELMMRRSAAALAIAPYRADQDHYKTSPYIVFEHNRGVRARKPRLVIAESRVAGRWFEASPLCVFQRDDPTGAKHLDRLVADLRDQSAPYAETAGHVLGSVGVVLPPGRAYRRAGTAIKAMLESAGYRVC